MSTLVIMGTVLADSGYYYCIVTDDYGNSTRSNSAHLRVNKIPVATIANSLQNNECSFIPFSDMVLGESYGVPGTSYLWRRTMPAGIVTTILETGTIANIGDAINGSFENTTDSPITITFYITPVGPVPTFCTGLTDSAKITINPVPRVVPVFTRADICDDRNAQVSLNTTDITLTTPTVMTQGVIRFDYSVSVTGLPGEVTGNTSPANDLNPGQMIAFTYRNYTDTIQSVYYAITPKVVGLGCNPGLVNTPEIKIHAVPLQDLEITKNLTCDGGSDATLMATISQGAGAYNILWNRPFAPPIRDSLMLHNRPGGRYDIFVTDNNGCYSTNYVYVQGATIGTRLDVTADVSCFGYNDGEVALRVLNDATSGIPPFEYWLVRNIQDSVAYGTLPATEVTNTHGGLFAGDYKLHLRDINGCSDTISEVTVRQPDLIAVTFAKQPYSGYDVSCKGYNDGHVWVNTISGGTGAYSYLWYTYNGEITGDSTQNRLDNIPAGMYYLRVTDANNCQIVDSVEIFEPDGMDLAGYELSFSRDSSFNISCAGGNDGTIEINVTGGSGTYSYNWTGPAGDPGNTAKITGLAAGTYSCSVMDQNGCELRLPPLATLPAFTLTEPTPLTLTAVPSLSVSGSENINCFGGTGSIDLTVTGGSTGNYNYSWTSADGSGIVAGYGDQGSLTAGTYNIVVTDSNLCSISDEITLTEPAEIVLSLIPTHITCISGNFDNGSIDLTVTGGVLPYNFAWSNGAGTEDITGLTEGYYTVTVTDGNGCQTTDSVRINLPPPLSFSHTLSDYNGLNISCFGLSNGSIEIELTSGEAPFVYYWTKPDGSVSTDQNLYNLKAGHYTLLITDKNNCTATGVFDLTEPGRLGMDITLSESQTGEHNISCASGNGGSIDINPVNSVGNVIYLWSDGVTGNSRTGLTAGNYQVILIDQNNCQTDSLIVLTQPDSIKIRFDVRQAFCPDSPDGIINTTITGGVPGPGYNFTWSDNSTTQNLTNILSGTYIITVRDANNCVVKDSVVMEPLNETCLVIPNAFTPNGDNINDVWNIDMIHLYPQIEVKIFDRWGTMLWRSEKGYPQPWDGRTKGALLPIDSYYYIIDLHNGTKPVVGNITIMR